MVVSRAEVGWTVVAFVLVALAVPWFMWGSDAVVAGLPVWVWYHVGWLCLTAVVFRVFVERGWGVGVRDGSGGTPPADDRRADGGALTDDRRGDGGDADG